MADPVLARRSLEKANRARAILEDELVSETFDRMERRLVETWSASAPSDMTAREESYRSLRALQNFRAEFERLISDGKVAERDLSEFKARTLRQYPGENHG
jgi:hypothetical protein